MGCCYTNAWPDADSLPDGFKRRIISVWGEAGHEWLRRLPHILNTCRDRWGLSLPAPVPNLSYNLVMKVVRADGTEAILKVGVPNQELLTEIAALRWYRGQGTVPLLAADPKLGALLLKRILPGSPLSEFENDEQAALIAAQLMRDLPVPVPAEHPFPTLDHWARGFNRLRDRFEGQTGPLPPRLVAKAEGLFADLQQDDRPKKLLHGDLHHENILADQENGWRVIDPKGVVGDPAYEAARFQHNPIPGFLSMPNPRQAARRRVEIIAETLQEDRFRLLAWAFFDTMLSACWCVEDNSDDWQFPVSCAEIFDTLMAG